MRVSYCLPSLTGVWTGNWHSLFPMACTPSIGYVTIVHQMMHDWWKITSLLRSVQYEEHTTHKRVWNNQNFTFQYAGSTKRKLILGGKKKKISRTSVKYNLQLLPCPCFSDLYDLSNLLLNYSESVTYFSTTIYQRNVANRYMFSQKMCFVFKYKLKNPDRTWYS